VVVVVKEDVMIARHGADPQWDGHPV
jgi:hypothetical protein